MNMMFRPTPVEYVLSLKLSDKITELTGLLEADLRNA